MKRILAISNRKGGSGKTTSAVNISAALAHKGRKVLVVDVDPQGHTTLSFGIDRTAIKNDLYTALVDECVLEDVAVKTYKDNLDVVPSTKRLLTFESAFSKDKDSRKMLSSKISQLNGQYDYVIFDTPPTISLMTVSALLASKEVYVPMQAHFLALEGLA